MSRRPFIPTLLIGLLAPLPLRAADTPTLNHLDRPDVKGNHQRCEFLYDTLTTTTTRWDGYAPTKSDQRHAFRLVADVEILNVDAKGDATARAIVVESFTQTDGDGAGQTVFPAGTRILSTSDGKHGSYAVGGTPVDGPAKSFLERNFPDQSGEDHISHDELYGVTAPRHVGESWPMSVKTYAASYRNHGHHVADADIAGQMTLDAIETVAGVPCFNLRCESEVKSFTPAGYETLPGGQSFKSASSTIQFHLFIPTDGVTDNRRVTQTNTYKIVTGGVSKARAYTTDQVTQEHVDYRALPPATTQPTSR